MNRDTHRELFSYELDVATLINFAMEHCPTIAGSVTALSQQDSLREILAKT